MDSDFYKEGPVTQRTGTKKPTSQQKQKPQTIDYKQECQSTIWYTGEEWETLRRVESTNCLSMRCHS